MMDKKKSGPYPLMECYPALKRKEILTYATMWMKLKDMMLSERSQTQDKYCVIPLTGGP